MHTHITHHDDCGCLTERYEKKLASAYSRTTQHRTLAANLRTELAARDAVYRRESDEVLQTLGRALRYPYFAHDQKNFPGAVLVDGVCTAAHTPTTIADEAAQTIFDLHIALAVLEVRLEHAYSKLDSTRKTVVPSPLDPIAGGD